MNDNTKNLTNDMDKKTDTSQQTDSAHEIGFDRILVSLDYPLSDREVFAQALDLAQKYKSSLMLCHCLHENLAHNTDFLMPSVVGSGVYATEVWDVETEVLTENKKRINEWLESLAKDADKVGVSADFVCLTGSAGEEICALAKEWGANLIVTGRRGLTGFSEALLGSVSNHIFHHSPCDVLVVQHPEEKDKK